MPLGCYQTKATDKTSCHSCNLTNLSQLLISPAKDMDLKRERSRKLSRSKASSIKSSKKTVDVSQPPPKTIKQLIRSVREGSQPSSRIHEPGLTWFAGQPFNPTDLEPPNKSFKYNSHIYHGQSANELRTKAAERQKSCRAKKSASATNSLSATSPCISSASEISREVKDLLLSDPSFQAEMAEKLLNDPGFTDKILENLLKKVPFISTAIANYSVQSPSSLFPTAPQKWP